MGVGSKGEIKDSSIIQRKNNLLHSEIQSEIVALDIDTSNYISFNSVGSRIWKFIESEAIFSDLVNKIVQEFDVNSEQARKDALIFLQKLYDKNLITVK